MKHLCLLLTALVLITSCQKETASSVQSEQLLRKFVILEIPSNDTLFIYNFDYDSRNRCTSIRVTDNTFGEQYTYTNFYNGNDTVIIQISILSDPVEKEYFTYDASGFLVKDSLLDDFTTLVYGYAKAGSRIAGTVESGGNFFLRSVHLQSYNASGDITSELDSSWIIDPMTSNEVFEAKIENTISYDNAPNPFYRIFPGRSVIMAYENWRELPMYYFWKGKNNILTQRRTVNNAGGGQGYSPFDDQFAYTYNNESYPTTVVYTDLINGETNKGFFFY